VKPDPPIRVTQSTLKGIKETGNGEGVVYAMDRRAILNIVNRKAKKPARRGREEPKQS
jgi:hypothetical protein